MGGAAPGLAADRFSEAAVEAFDEAVGLRAVGSGEAVLDRVLGADAIDGVAPGRAVARLFLHVDGEAVGELAAVVGEDGVNRMREVGEEALEEAGGGPGLAVVVELEVDVAGGAVDGDEGVALAALERGQVLEVEMDEADACRLEAADRRLLRLGPPARPWRWRQRWMALRESSGLMQRRITSTTSSSGSHTLVRSSQPSVSSSGESLVAKRLGVCGRSTTVLLPRHRRTVVPLTPS